MDMRPDIIEYIFDRSFLGAVNSKEDSAEKGEKIGISNQRYR